MQIVISIFIVLGTLGAAVGFLATVYPFKPFRNRKVAAGTFVMSLALIAALGAVVQGDSPASNKTAMEPNTALLTEIKPVSAVPLPCGNGGLIFNDVVAVSGESVLRAEPDATADKLKNAKATEALGKIQFHQIDNSTTVQRLCVQTSWTKVAIVTPEWLKDVSGWVPNSVLREIQTQEDGKRVYVEADFLWEKDSSKFKQQIIDVVNRIARENAKCDTIDPSSMTRSPSKSKPNDPVFFVTCGSGADVFNVWFKPGDAKSEKSFKAKEPVAQASAVEACESAAKAAANHPSTVRFSRIWDMAYVVHASGRARVVSSFTAKNSFNLELKFRIDCLFDGNSLIETNITESSQ